MSSNGYFKYPKNSRIIFTDAPDGLSQVLSVSVHPSIHTALHFGY